VIENRPNKVVVVGEGEENCNFRHLFLYLAMDEALFRWRYRGLYPCCCVFHLKRSWSMMPVILRKVITALFPTSFVHSSSLRDRMAGESAAFIASLSSKYSGQWRRTCGTSLCFDSNHTGLLGVFPA
jgi:hypothetical protein